MEFGPLQRNTAPGTDAEQVQRVQKSPKTGEVLYVHVTISLQAGDTRPPRIGHELYHVLELLLTGKDLRERYSEGDPMVKKSGTAMDKFESQGAKDAERRIELEIKEAKAKKKDKKNEP